MSLTDSKPLGLIPSTAKNKANRSAEETASSSRGPGFAKVSYSIGACPTVNYSTPGTSTNQIQAGDRSSTYHQSLLEGWVSPCLLLLYDGACGHCYLHDNRDSVLSWKLVQRDLHMSSTISCEMGVHAGL